MLKICYKPGGYSKQILTDIYRDIFISINNFSLISHKKDKKAVEKANLKKKQTGSNKWTDNQKKISSEKMKGNLNPMFGTRYQWMYLNTVNKRVPLSEVEDYLLKGWSKGRYKKSFAFLQKESADLDKGEVDIESQQADESNTA